jgi:hypothetical protein
MKEKNSRKDAKGVTRALARAVGVGKRIINTLANPM